MDSFDELEQLNDKPKRGRPTMYSPEVADRLIGYLHEGYGLRAISRMDGMPSHTTVARWKTTNPEFNALYEEARKLQLELMADDIMEIADNGGINVPLARLRTDVRKWLLSKLSRHVYGTTVKIEQAKPAPDVDYTKLSDEEFATVLALLEKAKADGDAD